MASNGALCRKKVSPKTPLTKRDAFQFDFSAHLKNSTSRMTESSDDQESCIQNDFTSCFLDESDSEDDGELEELENLSNHSPIYLSSSRLPLPGSHTSHSVDDIVDGTDTDIEDDDDIHEPLRLSGNISENNVSYGDHGDGHNEDIDFVDMAMSRDGEPLSSAAPDTLDQGLARGDLPQHSAIFKKEKYKRKDSVPNGAAKSRPRATSRSNSRKSNKKTFVPTVSFGWFDMFIGVFAILIFFVDIGTDIELATRYFGKEESKKDPDLKERYYGYGCVTAGLIIVPSLVTCFLGLHWYIIDYRKEKEVIKRLARAKKKAYSTPAYLWFLRIFFTAFQMGPVVRIVEYLYCGSMSQNKKLSERERRRYYRFMLYEDVDSCLLRLFESFLEAAPQLTWQLYIVVQEKEKQDLVGTSILAAALLSSWGSLAVSLCSYHKSLRNSHEEKAKMSIISLPFYFVWRASEIGGRVLCIAMFGSAFKHFVFVPLSFHWVVISGWLMMQKTTFYKSRCLERVFNIICGYVMIFCFLNLREGHTRFRFLLFYFIVYLENFIMLIIWFVETEDESQWYHLAGFIVVFVLFGLHSSSQLLYYAFFHPTKNIQRCVPCDRHIVYSSICYEIQPEEDNIAVGQVSERYAVNEIRVEPRKRQKSKGGGDETEMQLTKV